MIHFAICDDELKYRENMVSIISEYASQHHLEYKISIFDNAALLFKAYGRGEYFDCLFLDVFLKKELGAQVAKKMRACNIETFIIFMLDSSEYLIENLDIVKFEHVIKPLRKENIFPALDCFMENYQEERRRYIVIETNDGMKRIALRDIVFIEHKGKHIYVHLDDNKMLEARNSEKETLQSLLSFPDFVVCESHIVNILHVERLHLKHLQMSDGKMIKMAKGTHDAWEILCEQDIEEI